MELKKEILEVISGVKIAALATFSEKPRVRYMVTVGFEDLSLKAATRRSSTKVAHISKHPEVALTIWNGAGMGDLEKETQCVIIDALASIEDDLEAKKGFWNPALEKQFQGPEDPEYLLIKFRPSRIEYRNLASGEVNVWKSE